MYAWGVVAYETLTGAHPFAGKISAQQLIVAHMTEQPRHLQDAIGAAPGRIATLVMQCLEKDPQRRPRTGRELIEALTTE